MALPKTVDLLKLMPEIFDEVEGLLGHFCLTSMHAFTRRDMDTLHELIVHYIVIKMAGLPVETPEAPLPLPPEGSA